MYCTLFTGVTFQSRGIFQSGSNTAQRKKLSSNLNTSKLQRSITMMIPQVSLLLLFSSFQVSKALFKPYQIPYDDLLVGHVSSYNLINALKSDGMVAISDMAVDGRLFRSQHPCLLQQAGQVLKAPDGTVRYTLATQTTPLSSAGAGGLNALTFKNEDPTGSVPNTVCQEFNESSLSLRLNAHAAVQAFASVLDLALGLVPQEQGREQSEAASSFTDIIQRGTHLEHFHSYVKTTRTAAVSQEQEQAVNNIEEPPTLDWHVDQGVFLAFMPGRYETSGEITQGFYIRNAQGEAEQVDFAGASLVFMLGDGVNRYVNHSKYVNNKLRPVHHALRVPTTKSAGGQARIWFGLMVLPPAGALITTPHQSLTTFGDIRDGLMQMQPDAFVLGCSQGITTAVSGSSPRRELAENVGTDPANHTETSDPSISSNLEELNCPAGDQVYCWHRCMNLTEYALTHEMCKAQDQLVSCLNPRGQLSDGDSHGDFFLACAAADTPPVSNFTTLPDHPRVEEMCDDFDTFVSSEQYDYSMTFPGGSGAVLQWSVVKATAGSTEKKFINGRLAFNGIFGYLSIGKSGIGGRIKMYNAPVIFALRGSNYTPKSGFELDTEPYVGEYSTFICFGNSTVVAFVRSFTTKQLAVAL
jgi:hypothetical protein